MPLEHTNDAYNLIKSKKELYTFKDAKHVKAERMYREKYWSIIDKFLKENFK